MYSMLLCSQLMKQLVQFGRIDFNRQQIVSLPTIGKIYGFGVGIRVLAQG